MPDDDEVIQRAAAHLAQATHILIGAGAGMSADSGLRTYADAMHEAALAEVAREKQAAHAAPVLAIIPVPAHGPHSASKCVPRLLDGISAELPPSRASRGLSDLGEALRLQGCRCHTVYTSNVDGLFRRFQTLRARLHEIHGRKSGCAPPRGYTSSAEGSSADDEGMTWHSRGGARTQPRGGEGGAGTHRPAAAATAAAAAEAVAAW